jgi:hypothetical protein
MTPPVQATSPATPVAPPGDLHTFAAAVRAGNPFAVNRVDRLAAPVVDVSGIHRAPYEKIIALAREACEHNRGIGAVLWGDAGTGKSHLLARLHGWAAQDHHASFVYLHNLLADPEQLPRYVLKYVISYLTGGLAGPLDRTILFRLLNAAVAEALKHDGAKEHTWSEAEASYNRLVDRLAGQDPTRAVLLNRDVYRVLFLFFRSVYCARRSTPDGLVPLAVRWLSGEPLDPEEATQLGLRAGRGSEEGVGLADDEQVKQVLVALTQLALSRRQPFLLCFDQLENLGPERIHQLASFLHGLLDSAGNLLVVFCGLKRTLFGYQQTGTIHEAAWHRLAQHKLDLHRIDRAEGRHILEARLEKFLEPFVSVPGIKEQLAHDSLFPLGRTWYDQRVSESPEVQPRRVIDWARERWEQQQARLAAEPAADWLRSWPREGPALPPPSRKEAVDALVAAKVAELTARRRQEPHTLPPSAENLAGLVHTLLQQCLNRPGQYALTRLSRPAALKKTMRPPYDFRTHGAAGPDGKAPGVGVLFLGTGSATSAAGSLRRLVQAPTAVTPDRLLLVTEERQPLKLARAGQGYLKQLSARGSPAFSQTTLTFEQYAQLDALQAVVGLARSGDLEVEAGPGESPAVREDEVIDSHHWHGRYLQQKLLAALLDLARGKDPEPPCTKPPPVDEKDLREFIGSRLALKMGASSHEMAEWYAEYRARKGAPPLDPAACKAAVEKAARQLHAEEKLQATPASEGLYLLWK